MHKPSVSFLVYKTLFPRPRQGDPTSLPAHINRNLVPEVRIETASFYGALDCIEAQYPGLDYSYIPHRTRLSRFPWHRKLFRAFDELGLTRNEILSLCQWEGTKSAKDKYERDVGRMIRDTISDDIAPAEVRRRPTAYRSTERRQPQSEGRAAIPCSPVAAEVGPEVEEVKESDGTVQMSWSTGDGNIRDQLRWAAEARARADGSGEVDEQWEQWLKEAVERNEMGMDGMMEAIRQGRPFPISPSHILDATVDPPSLRLASGSSPNANPSMATSAMNDTQIAMVNVWNLGNEIVRNVNAGNGVVVASVSATAPATTTTGARPAGEAR